MFGLELHWQIQIHSGEHWAEKYRFLEKTKDSNIVLQIVYGHPLFLQGSSLPNFCLQQELVSF